jgi:urease subunit beta
MKPGEYILEDDDIVANDGRPTAIAIVSHTGDRPIQIGSHYHFFEVNSALTFDRQVAYGMRLNIAAGTAIRFEPGEEKEVELTPFAGERIMFGHKASVQGPL